MKTLLIKETQLQLHISLNLPDSRNAFRPEMIAELTKVFKDAAKKDSLRFILLTGEGSSFCAGADLGWMKSMVSYTQGDNVKDAEKLYNMFLAMRECPLPIICKVQGHAMGGALGLVAVSDLVVAEEKAQFCFSEVKLGLSPAVISAFVKNKISSSSMSRWFLTAEVFSAQQAQEMGLVHSVCSGEKVEQQITAWTQSLLANGPQAVRETKKLIQNIYQMDSQTKMKPYTTRLIAKLRVGAEGQEGLKSAIDRKKPSWGNG